MAPSDIQTTEQQSIAEKAAQELGFLSVEELRIFLLAPPQPEKIPEIPEEIFLPKPEIPEFLEEPVVPAPQPVILPLEKEEIVLPLLEEEERVTAPPRPVILSVQPLVQFVVKTFVVVRDFIPQSFNIGTKVVGEVGKNIQSIFNNSIQAIQQTTNKVTIFVQDGVVKSNKAIQESVSRSYRNVVESVLTFIQTTEDIALDFYSLTQDIVSRKPLAVISERPKDTFVFRSGELTLVASEEKPIQTTVGFRFVAEIEPSREAVDVVDTFPFDDSDNDGVWETEIAMSPIPGEFTLNAKIVYADGEIKELKAVTLIDPEGYVYEQTSRGELRIENAKVTLWQKVNGEWIIWSAEKYAQQNPKATNRTGQYAFLAPPGEYYLEIVADNYELFVGKPFVLEQAAPVHANIELQYLGESL